MKTSLLGTMSVAVAFSVMSGISVTPISAQGLGTINGTVTDPSAALVPSAKVKVANQGTGLTRETQSNTQGYFVVPSLPPATYNVTIESPGSGRFFENIAWMNSLSSSTCCAET